MSVFHFLNKVYYNIMVHNPAVAILLCVNTSFELSTFCLRVRECTITPPVSSTQLPECHKSTFVALWKKCGTIMWHYMKNVALLNTAFWLWRRNLTIMNVLFILLRQLLSLDEQDKAGIIIIIKLYSNI